MYAWIITRDLIDTDPTKMNSVGVTGPSNASDVLVARLKVGGGECFRLYDDDHVLCYEGRIIHKRSGFEPLDDYGIDNDGCTRIKYHEPDGEWRYL